MRVLLERAEPWENKLKQSQGTLIPGTYFCEEYEYSGKNCISSIIINVLGSKTIELVVGSNSVFFVGEPPVSDFIRWVDTNNVTVSRVEL